jgi:CheY-like chemotaxis protein
MVRSLPGGVMSNRRVLIVEDYPDARDLIFDWLASFGYEPIAACNGLEALELLSRGADPGLILLDLRMPKMDGWTFMELALERQLLGHARVWVTSAAEAPRPPAGIDGALYKPLDLDALGQVVARICGPADPAGDTR